MLNSTGRYTGQRSVNIPSFKPVTSGNYSQIAKAAKMISEAERPLLYAGGGVMLGGAWEELTAFAEKFNLPVTTTLLGLGCFPESKPQSLGMLGMHGTWTANMATTECDLLIAVGARFDDRVTGRLDGSSPHPRKIPTDIGPCSSGKNVSVDVPIVGDAKQILPHLNELTREMPDTADWWKTLRQWQKEHPLPEAVGKGRI